MIEAAANPEAIVTAAINARIAADAANQAYYMSLMVLGSIGLMAIAMFLVAFNFAKLTRNTDGMREDLVLATRKLALIEGNLIGRAEQTAEQKQKEK